MSAYKLCINICYLYQTDANIDIKRINVTCFFMNFSNLRVKSLIMKMIENTIFKFFKYSFYILLYIIRHYSLHWICKIE
jgi:hypothetical protein